MQARRRFAAVEATILLRRELEREPIVRAYLFGSQVTGAAGPLSDVDVAILPRPEVRAEERLLLQGRVSLAAAAAYGVDHADVVLLDEAPPGVAFAAISGTLLLDQDPASRETSEARIMSVHHDRAYAEARWTRATLARYAKGEFA
jgi:predicted nucleotidyltransferase